MKQTQVGKYSKVALAVLATIAGAVTLAAFPGLAHVIKEFSRSSRRHYSPRAMQQTVQRLRARGYVRVVERGDELLLQLTAEGRRAVKKLRLKTLTIPKPTRWDKQWRFIAFDIPEKKRPAREAFRKKLQQLGCAKIQKSLFVHPYSCKHEIAYLTDTLQIEPFVRLIIATSFNGDRRLRTRYQLS